MSAKGSITTADYLPYNDYKRLLANLVSIHTPARGVTVSNLGHLFSISYTIENANERFCIREKRVLIIYECQHIDSQDVRKFQ